MKIPFVDLRAQYDSIKDEIHEAINGIIETSSFIGGKKLAEFEQNFAKFVEADHAVGTSSGTSALHLAFVALGIGPGDEVITACNTFIATTEAISHSGATPVLVDVDENTMNIRPDLVEAAITPKTKAIVPVHLYGQSADMDAIRDIASRHKLRVIADAAQAHGAERGGKRKAIQGEVTCFSFYPGKNLGAYGDGGMIVTDDGDLAERMRRLGNHGRHEKYTHIEEGFNYRLDTLQAAILDVKLRHLEDWTERRRGHAKRYDGLFDGGPARPVLEEPGNRHVYHLYVVRVPERERVMKALAGAGVSVGIHYPVPLHLQEAYKHLGLEAGAFPVAEKAADEIVSLPMYAELGDDMVDAVASELKKALT